MSLKSKYKVDTSLAAGGVWFTKATNSDKSVCRIKLRRSGRGNPDWNRVFREHSRDLDTDNLSTEDDNRLMGGVFAEACVIDWEHLQPEDDGVELPFSTQAAVNLLSDPDWLDLLTELQGNARNIEGFQDKREAEAKN